MQRRDFLKGLVAFVGVVAANPSIALDLNPQYIELQNIFQDSIKDILEMANHLPNDEYTRGNVVTLIEEWLKHDGLSDYSIICDETNNTPDIVNKHGFVVDLFVKPKNSNKELHFQGTTTCPIFTFETLKADNIEAFDDYQKDVKYGPKLTSEEIKERQRAIRRGSLIEPSKAQQNVLDEIVADGKQTMERIEEKIRYRKSFLIAKGFPEGRMVT